jgi:hypothetical protein
MAPGQLLGRLLLQFDADAAAVPEDLSAAVKMPDGTLWVAADEAGVLERLTRSEPRIYGDHQRFQVADFLGGVDASAELDIEALDHHDGYLWFVGSHSATRKKPKGKGAQKDLARLATVEHAPQRFALARIPYVKGALAQQVQPGGARGSARAAARVAPAGPRKRPASKRAAEEQSLLVELLRRDPHFAPFLTPVAGGSPASLAIPSKDNGLDIEGLIAHDGDQLLLGLRGPVLRGYAALLELRMDALPGGLLEPRALKKGGRYRKHFLELDGLGIRELCVHGKDLLVLAGPTLPVEAPIRLFRLHDFASLGGDSVIRQEKGVLEPLFDIPHTGPLDHAEGVALFSWFAEADSVLVVYDTPAPERRYGPCGVFADVFRIVF